MSHQLGEPSSTPDEKRKSSELEQLDPERLLRSIQSFPPLMVCGPWTIYSQEILYSTPWGTVSESSLRHLSKKTDPATR